METEKLFNLQLTIQKLEEELTLYRNGATTTDLIEIISEKDAEISSLKNILQEKNEVISKFHRGTIEVLKQNEMLTKDLEILKHEKMKLQEEIVTLQTLYTELKEKNILQIKEFEQNIQEKNHELEDNHEIIHKLQLQCANIVKEKQELYKSYEFDKEDWNDLKEKYENEIVTIKQISSKFQQELEFSRHELSSVKIELEQTLQQLTLSKEQNQQYLHDLNDSHQVIQEAKHMITTAKQENELAMKTFHETDRTNKLTIQTLQEQVHDHIQELENLRNLHSIRIDEKNMKERELQQIILSKDDRLREVTYELDVAKRACEELIKQNHKSLQDRETHWQQEYEKLERLLENTNQKLKRMETERDRNLTERREHDILKAKYATLEDKIKRQEAYMKSRFLKDKSNILHVPDAALMKSTTPTSTGTGTGSITSTGGIPSSSSSSSSYGSERLSTGSARSSRSTTMVVGPNQTVPSAQKNHEI